MNERSFMENRSDKSLRILDAAIRVFARKGFYNSTIADVAKIAEVAEGTIYLYFKSKDDLLICLFEEQMSQVNGALEQAILASADPSEKLRGFIRKYVELIEGNPKAAEVLTIELRQSAKFMKQFSNPRFAEFLKLLGSYPTGQ